MSGRTKRILYTVTSVFLMLAAAAGSLLLMFFYAKSTLDYALIALVVLLCRVLPVLFHEVGHLLFGLTAGLRPIAVSVGWLTFGKGKVKFGKRDADGATLMLPKKAKHARGKLIFFALGGAVSDLAIGGVLLALFFVLPFHSALLFFSELAPFFLAEGILALLPAELSAGKTDGAVVLSHIKKTSDAEVELRVFVAHGLLYRGTFSEIPREILFNTPVVREDLPAFVGLLQLRLLWLLDRGEMEEAKKTLERLLSLEEDFPEDKLGERYAPCLEGKPPLDGEPSPLYGVRELTERLK